MEEERFIGGWTRSKLTARTPEERYAIWKRAKSLRTADGNQLAREIEMLGLPYAEPGLLAEADPMRGEMAAIMARPEARSACIEATLDGLPAIAGVDPLFHEAFGPAYRRSDEAIATANALVAALMGERGYVEAGRKDLPSRYVARSGLFWKRK
ncbi:MAG: hypothetical protein P4L64_13940 [Caulobacteraceae bacterium]|nr:hypothetical protein [Caulobacteraceae bacterium]